MKIFVLITLSLILITLLIAKYFSKKPKLQVAQIKEKGLVWYASYGSNLNEERFLCYIQGGKPDGSKKVERGARDKTPPRQNLGIQIPYPLYFAKYSKRWGGAVAFIDKVKNEQNTTYGRMYLITEEQFIDVVNQENSTNDLTIDLDQVKIHGQLSVRQSWYGNIIYLGEKDGYPIFTFTANWDLKDINLHIPSEAYLKMLISGLKKLNILTDQEIVDYFMNKPGVKDNYSTRQIEEIIEQM